MDQLLIALVSVEPLLLRLTGLPIAGDKISTMCAWRTGTLVVGYISTVLGVMFFLLFACAPKVRTYSFAQIAHWLGLLLLTGLLTTLALMITDMVKGHNYYENSLLILLNVDFDQAVFIATSVLVGLMIITAIVHTVYAFNRRLGKTVIVEQGAPFQQFYDNRA